MDVKQRTSEKIDAEMQLLRGKLRALESEKQEHTKALEKAQRERKKSAYAAHGEKDAKARERLTKAHTAQREAELALEDLEGAISEGRAMFETLEIEWKAALDAEAWAALMAEADLAKKEAEQLDIQASAMAELLGVHGRRLEQLKRQAHNLGFPRCFGTVGLRHFDRVFAWKMIQAGFAKEYEKPSEQFRKASGYAEILAEQITAAKNIHDHTNMEQAGQDGDGLDHELALPPEADPAAAQGEVKVGMQA